MRTLALASLLVALAPVLVQAQAAPAQAPIRVIEPQPQAPAPATPTPALAPAAPEAAAAVAAPPTTIVLVPAPAPVVVAPAPPAATPLPPPGSAAQAVPPPGYQLAPPSSELQPPTYGAAAPSPDYCAYCDPNYAAHLTALHGQLEEVDGRLGELKRDRPSVSGPIAMMVAGYGVFMVSGLVALGSFAAAESIENGYWDNFDDPDDADINNDGTLDGSDEQAARTTARVFTSLSMVGLGLGIGGSVMFARRMDERRANNPEIRQLKLRRKEIRRELKYGAQVTPEQAKLTVGGRF